LFQCGGFSVLIHEPVEIRFRTFGPGWRVISADHIFIVFAPEIPDLCSLKEHRGVAPREREKDVVYKCDRGCGAFNIQQYAVWCHDTNDRPRQTGSKRASTPLSV